MPPLSADYVNESKGPKILGTFWAFFIVSSFMVSARLHIRARMLRNIGLEDYIIALTMVWLTGYTIITTVNVHLGYGSHAAVIQQNGGQELLERVLLINFGPDFAMGIMGFATPKLAVVALLIRILNPGRIHRFVLWFLAGLVLVSSIICIIVILTNCNPPKALWEVHLLSEGATCRDPWIMVNYCIFTGAISAFVDLYLASYPTFVLSKLQISLRKKLALCAVLGLGAVACAMAIVKCFQLPGLANAQDPTYGTADLVIWTSIEGNVIVIAACIPTLGPLYEIMRGKRSWGSYNPSYNNRYHKSDKEDTFGLSSVDRKKPTAVAHPHDDLFTTNVDATTRHSSQDSILNADKEQNSNLPLGRIRRTDQVQVEYGN